MNAAGNDPCTETSAAPPVGVPAGLVVMTAEALDRLVYAASKRAVSELLAALPATRTVEAERADEELLGRDEVAALLGVTARTIGRREKAGTLPRGIRVGAKIVRWRRDTIATYMKTGVAPAATEVLDDGIPPPKPAQKHLRKRAPRRSVFDEARDREAAAKVGS